MPTKIMCNETKSLAYGHWDAKEQLQPPHTTSRSVYATSTMSWKLATCMHTALQAILHAPCSLSTPQQNFSSKKKKKKKRPIYEATFTTTLTRDDVGKAGWKERNVLSLRDAHSRLGGVGRPPVSAIGRGRLWRRHWLQHKTTTDASRGCEDRSNKIVGGRAVLHDGSTR
jgi:hypothetical protein